MLKTKLIAGAVIVACTLGAATGVAFAAAKHAHHVKAPAATLDSGPPASLHCKKGQTPILHTMGKMSWACVKV